MRFTQCVFLNPPRFTLCISHSDCLFKLSSYGVILWLRLKQWKILSGGKRQLIHCYSWMHLEAAHFGSAILVVCDLKKKAARSYTPIPIFNGNLMFRGNRLYRDFGRDYGGTCWFERRNKPPWWLGCCNASDMRSKTNGTAARAGTGTIQLGLKS